MTIWREPGMGGIQPAHGPKKALLKILRVSAAAMSIEGERWSRRMGGGYESAGISFSSEPLQRFPDLKLMSPIKGGKGGQMAEGDRVGVTGYGPGARGVN